MSGESPDVVIYDINGNALAVQNATSIPVNTPAFMTAGSDGTNSRYFLVDSSGRSIVVGYGAATTNAPSYSPGTTNPLSLSTTGGLRITGLGTAGAADTNVVTVQGISSGTVIPISGTVTANQGTAGTLVNAWPHEITDGVNGPVAVKPASTAAVTTDSALVVAISPNNIATVQGSTAAGSTLSNNPFVTGAVNSLNQAQSISATMINGLTHLNVVDLPSQNKLDMIIILLIDIRSALMGNSVKTNSQ